MALNPPVSRRFTRRGITPDLPIATLLSSTCDRQEKSAGGVHLGRGSSHLQHFNERFDGAGRSNQVFVLVAEREIYDRRDSVLLELKIRR